MGEGITVNSDLGQHKRATERFAAMDRAYAVHGYGEADDHFMDAAILAKAVHETTPPDIQDYAATSREGNKALAPLAKAKGVSFEEMATCSIVSVSELLGCMYPSFGRMGSTRTPCFPIRREARGEITTWDCSEPLPSGRGCSIVLASESGREAAWRLQYGGEGYACGDNRSVEAHINN